MKFFRIENDRSGNVFGPMLAKSITDDMGMIQGLFSVSFSMIPVGTIVLEIDFDRLLWSNGTITKKKFFDTR